MILARVQWENKNDFKIKMEKRIFALSGRDPKMYMNIQKIVYQSTAVNFALQGRPKWAERSEKYRQWAERKYKTFWPILLMTSKLMDTTLKSIQRPWQHQGDIHKLNISSIFYGYFHQYGRKQKVRQYVKITSDEHQKIMTTIKQTIKG